MRKLIWALLLLPFAAQADCTVSAFSRLQLDSSGRELNIGLWPPLSTQTVTVSGTAAEPSSAFPSGTRFLIFKCTAKTHFAVGPIATVTATTSDLWVAADEDGFVGLDTIANTISFISGS